MRKTRRINRRRSKTYIKKGGDKNKKNNIDMSTLTTQMVGGQQTPAPSPAPRPAPAPAVAAARVASSAEARVASTPAPAVVPPPAGVNYNLDYASVVQSLQTFGETVWELKEATALGKEAAAERVLAAEADKAAVDALDTAAASLYNAYFGAGTGNARTRGLFDTLVPSTTFIPPPSASPSPATR